MTGIEDGYPPEALDGLRVVSTDVASLPRYANSYNASGTRTQFLLSEGSGIPVDLFGRAGACDVLFLAPAYHEIGQYPRIRARIRAASLQGALRATDATGRVVHRSGAWQAVRRIATPGALCFLSDEDTADAAALARQIAAAGAVAIVTHGPAGATRYDGLTTVTRPAAVATPTDPTGAGDCFAMAYSVRFAETGDADAAFSFGLTAGALAVEGIGIAGIPSRAAIEDRLTKVAA
ncbi:MAG: PfkB family carbohydrate kinase [Dehalococcoidia bacterium]